MPTDSDRNIIPIIVCATATYIVTHAWGYMPGLLYLVESGILATGLEMIQNKLPCRKIVIDFLMKFMCNEETLRITSACCLFLAVIIVISTCFRQSNRNKNLDKAIKEQAPRKRANKDLSKGIYLIAKQYFVDEYKDAQMQTSYCPFHNISIDLLAVTMCICLLVLVWQLLPNWQPTGVLEILRLHPSISDSLPNVQMTVAQVMLCVMIFYSSPQLTHIWRLLDIFAYKHQVIGAKTRPPPMFKWFVNTIIVLLLNMFLHGAFGHAIRQIVNGEDYTTMLRFHVIIFVFLLNNASHMISTSVLSPLLVIIGIWLHLACEPFTFDEWLEIFLIIIFIEQRCELKCEQNPHFILVMIPASQMSGAFCWDVTVGSAMKQLLSQNDKYNKILIEHKKHLDYFNVLVLGGNLFFATLFFIRQHRKTQKQMNVKSFCEQAGELTQTLNEILANPQSYVFETCIKNPGLTIFWFFILWSFVENMISEHVQIKLMQHFFGQSQQTVDVLLSFFTRTEHNRKMVEFECTLWATS